MIFKIISNYAWRPTLLFNDLGWQYGTKTSTSVTVCWQADFRPTHLSLWKTVWIRYWSQGSTQHRKNPASKTEPKFHITFSCALHTLKNFSLPLLKGSPNGGSLGALPKGTELGHPLTWCLFSSLVYETENRWCYTHDKTKSSTGAISWTYHYVQSFLNCQAKYQSCKGNTDLWL